MPRRVYLSGPITGLDYATAKDGWRRDFADALWPTGHNIVLLSPMRAKTHLIGDTNMMADGAKHIIARDLSDIRRSDLMVVNLNGAKRVSIGTMIEMGVAHSLGIPMILIWDYEAEPDNPMNHGWVTTLATSWVNTVPEAAKATLDFLSEGL